MGACRPRALASALGLGGVPGRRAIPDGVGPRCRAVEGRCTGPGPSVVRTPGLPWWQLPGVRDAATGSPWRQGRGSASLAWTPGAGLEGSG